MSDKLYSISKSAQRALSCETHFAEYYLGSRVLKRVFSQASDSGTAFHHYRAAYITHLLGASKDADLDWVSQYIRTTQVSRDARELIEKDAAKFTIDPEKVLGTEVYLSVDAEFKPLQFQTEATYETAERSELRLADGFVDLLMIDGSTAIAVDYKTGFHIPSEPDEYEPASYAALIFAHLPYVETVIFAWDYVRAGGQRQVDYPRIAMDGLIDMIRYEHRRRDEIAERYFAGKALSVNPYSGLCGFCEIDCPLRKEARTDLVAGPIQTEQQALEIAARIKGGDDAMRKYRAALRGWLAEHGSVPAPGGYEVALVPGVDLKLSVEQVAEMAHKWDFEQGSVGASLSDLKRFAKAKKRAGMMEELFEIGKKTPNSDLKIRKTGEVEEYA